MESEQENIQIAALNEVALRSHDAVVIIDKTEAKVSFANTAAGDLLEIGSGDGIEKIGTLIESVISTDRDYVKNKYHNVNEQLAVTNVEFAMTRSNGEVAWLSCDAYQVHNKRFLYAIARDVTKARQHEKYLVEYGARKNTLLDTVMHQLNGSLGLMKNLALRAKRLNVATDRPALDEFINLIHNTSRHSIDIIDDLLKKEHTESPGIHVKFNRTDVVKIVTYIFDELRKTHGGRTIMFETNNPIIFINTDEVKLLQVVNNFASNAVKFTREGDEIKMSLRETPNSVVIAVSDTGIGIPDELKPFVFEKHGPARRTGLNGEKSVGLGLSICNHLTNLIGGRMWFESQAGVGSTFFVELSKD